MMMTNVCSELAEICYAFSSHYDHESAERNMHALLENDRFALAYHLVSEGFCVLPLCRDGKRPTRKWKPLQTRLTTARELIDWFFRNDFTPGIVTGQLSGITVIDCDSQQAVEQWLRRGLSSQMIQNTRRGRHFVFQWAGERNTVRVDGMPGVDRRGEGGYVKAYPDAINWTRESAMLAPIL